MHPSTIAKRRVERHEGPQVVPPRVPSEQRHPTLKHLVVRWARWLHIYLSMVSFAILFFFAVTGLTLNHQQWFAGQARTAQFKGQVEAAWLRGNVAKLEIVEYLRSHHKISAAVNEFRVDDAQASISFKGPGYEATAFIDRASGAYDVTETKMGLAGIMNDLHKGRDSGKVWGWLIDASAVFMTFVSASGIVLLLFLQKRRYSGLMAGVAGVVLCTTVYLVWVP
ncbi:MAG TPA: PepSY-associated TM helix domain-containing protein [Candidatus Solibacter sp.]|nr:PepSY-associated TM helix domain-containing protein [Candidatus Solibacter sp.]